MPVFVYLGLTPTQEERLRRVAPGEDLYVQSPSPDDKLPATLQSSDVVFGNVPPVWLDKARNVRWAQLESVGFGEYADMLKEPAGRRLQVTNLADFFSEPVAKTALAGILALYRGLDRLLLQRRDARWLGDSLRPQLRCLRGARVLIFGRGGIGTRLGELLAPLGCAVTALGRGWTAEELDATVSASDIVIAAAPHTPGTRGVFDLRRLSLMPRGAVFCNVGRGSVVDEAALAGLLEEGRLSGAVIDVTLEEPLPPGHPFWTCPGLVLTQHTGGGTCDEIDRKIDHFGENLARFRRGEPVVGEVDVTKGY